MAWGRRGQTAAISPWATPATGTLSITGGGKVSNYNANIGAGSGSDGTASVDGPGSVWTNNSVLAVGSSGDGRAQHHRRRRGLQHIGRIARSCRLVRHGPHRRPGFEVDASGEFTMGLIDTGTATLRSRTAASYLRRAG